jgi:hypothetical protein
MERERHDLAVSGERAAQEFARRNMAIREQQEKRAAASEALDAKLREDTVNFNYLVGLEKERNEARRVELENSKLRFDLERAANQDALELARMRIDAVGRGVSDVVTEQEVVEGADGATIRKTTPVGRRLAWEPDALDEVLSRLPGYTRLPEYAPLSQQEPEVESMEDSYDIFREAFRPPELRGEP